MDDLWTRLKQRKLVQWALAYVAFAFAFLQGVDIVAQQFAWPDSVQRATTLALVLGFFVTLLLAWYHGEQGRQRVSGTELLLIALVLGFGGGFLWWVSGSPREPVHALAAGSSPARARSATTRTGLPVPATATVPEKSVAVLPFANESGDKNEQFFSDGLSEDLITALSQFPGLKVINRSSSFKFRNSTQGVAAIAHQLGVAHLLEGGVRKLGDEVRIRAELVNADDGSTLWSAHYDRPYKDLFKLQDDITRAVADALKTRLMGGVVQSDRPPSGNLDAYEAFLKGKAQPTTEAGVRRAIRLYTDATRIDPDYARAYAALGETWAYKAAALGINADEIQQAFDHARTATDTALRLDPESIAAHYARGFILLNADLDWQGVRDQADLLIKLAPDNRVSLNLQAQVYAFLGKPQQTELDERKIIALDPLNAGTYEGLALALRAQGRLNESAATLDKAIELAPGDNRLHANLALVELLRGDHDAAAAAARAESSPFWSAFAQAAVLQTGQDRQAADAALQQVIQRYADNGAYQIAELYALRKDPDGMFHWLERAWVIHDPGLQHLLTDPFILRYKHDPRFAAFCRKIGLPVPGEKDNHPPAP